MAVPDILSNYIAKNYKRLLVCVVPPATSETDSVSPSAPPPDGMQARSSSHTHYRARGDHETPTPHAHDGNIDRAVALDLTADGNASAVMDGEGNGDTGRRSSDTWLKWRRRRSSGRPRSLRGWRTRAHPEHPGSFVYVRSNGDEFVRGMLLIFHNFYSLLFVG